MIELHMPLITFAILAYNQETFIREALEGAFSQTYSPLEIVLSDDHSSDRTFDIMEEMTVQYRGDHSIILNRNNRNLGIGGHINRIMQISAGEFVVLAGGDDISLPERTSEVYVAWQKLGQKVMSIYSDVIIIDESGREKGFLSNPMPDYQEDLNNMALNLCPGVIGASHAFSRQLFTRFGSLKEPVMFEDRALSFRALLMGKIIQIHKPLVKYRRHNRNLIHYKPGIRPRAVELKKQHTREITESVRVIESYIHDLGPLGCDLMEIENLLIKKGNALRFQRDFMNGNPLEKLAAIREGLKRRVPYCFLIKTIIKYMIPIAYYLYQQIKESCRNEEINKTTNRDAA